MAEPLISPMAAHGALAACLNALLTVAGAPAIRGVGRKPVLGMWLSRIGR